MIIKLIVLNLIIVYTIGMEDLLLTISLQWFEYRLLQAIGKYLHQIIQKCSLLR